MITIVRGRGVCLSVCGYTVPSKDKKMGLGILTLQYVQSTHSRNIFHRGLV